MAALDSSDVTITITETSLAGTPPKRHVRGTIAIAGVDTYPTGGIPLPVIGLFGMIRQLDELRVSGQAAATTQYVYQYDRTNHTLQLFEEEAAAAGGPLLECDTSEVPGARTLDFAAVGW